MPATVRLMSWGMPLLYAGPAFDLPAHRKSVAQLCICLDGQMEVHVRDGAGEMLRATCSSAFIKPGAMQLVRFEPGRIACLYLDEAVGPFTSITAGMRRLGSGLLVDHPGELRVAEALAARDALSACNRQDVEEAFGLPLSMTNSPDARVAQATSVILADPGLMHRATRIARLVGLSESRLRHAFRDSRGVSLKRFRLWARMGAGLSLVGAGASLTRAAHEAGFSSSAHFSTAYRALFGLKPSAVVRANPLLGPARPALRRLPV